MAPALIPPDGKRGGVGRGGASVKRTINVLLVDDHTVVREGICSMLSGERDIVMVGEASSGYEAVRKTNDLEPHVVLMDVRMPGMSGIEATRHIKSANPTVPVIILTMYDSDMYVIEAIQAGASLPPRTSPGSSSATPYDLSWLAAPWCAEACWSGP